MKQFLCITGGIACGKTTVLNYLSKFYEINNADDICHEMTPFCTGDIRRLFGEEALTNGEVDRKKLGNIVFNDEKKRKQLEEFLHPIIKDNIEARLCLTVGPVALECPLLFEAGWEEDYRPIIVVTCSENVQLERLMKRNNLSEKDAKKRIAAQIPLKEKTERADFVLDTTDGIDTESLERFINE